MNWRSPDSESLVRFCRLSSRNCPRPIELVLKADISFVPHGTRSPDSRRGFCDIKVPETPLPATVPRGTIRKSLRLGASAKAIED